MGDSESFYGRGSHKVTQSDLEIARIAGLQFGVISLEQLQAIGLTYDDIRRRLERGQLHRVHRDVFAVGHTSLSAHARLFAALLTCGATSFLSHRTAAGVWGLRELATRSIEVTIPTTKSRLRPGLTLHRTSRQPSPEDLAVRNGLRVSSVPQLLIELASRESPAELDRLITQAVRKRVLDLPAVERSLARRARRPGVAMLKAALENYRPRPDRKSDLERAFDKLIEGTDIPAPLRNVTIDGWEIDCYWPAAKLAVELDGRPYHIAVRDMEKDRYKDAKLLRKGIVVLRFTDVRLSLDAQGVLDDVRALAA